MGDINQVIAAIQAKRKSAPSKQAILVAISGIDGSGKGFLTEHIVSRLRQKSAKAVGIGIDGWLNLPATRFNEQNPSENFYQNAIRFTEMFEMLILPLKVERRINFVADYTEETATEYRRHHYEFWDGDIIILEGVFLLKREFRRYYEMTVWVDCTFETAMERALQ